VSLLTNLDTWHSKRCVLGRGHVSLLTNLVTWHFKLVRDIGYLCIFSPTCVPQDEQKKPMDWVACNPLNFLSLLK
jgi:hypothetical protein